MPRWKGKKPYGKTYVKSYFDIRYIEEDKVMYRWYRHIADGTTR
jgi:hypothetical protein